MKKLITILFIFISYFGVVSHSFAANKYWFGGTGTWDNTNTANWSLSSGGPATTTAPASTDNVFFDTNSGTSTSTVSIATGAAASDLTTTNFPGTLGGAASITIFGNLTFGASSTISGTGILNLGSASAGRTFTSNGKVWLGNVAFIGIGGYALQDDLKIASGKSLLLTKGTLDFNGHNAGAFDDPTRTTTFSSNNINTRTLTLGSGSLYFGTWNISLASGLTFNKGSGTIFLTKNGASDRNFFGGGLTYNNLTFYSSTNANDSTQAFSGQITNGNTFNKLEFQFGRGAGIGHDQVYFGTGVTQTVNQLVVTGNPAGSKFSFNPNTASTAYTIAKAGGGKVSVDYINVSYSIATPTNTFFAGTHSTNGGNNSGWTFSFPWGFRTIKAIGTNHF